VEVPVPVLVPVPVEVPVLVPVPVDVPVVVDAFRSWPRSICDPLLNTTPCKVVVVVLVPNASVNVTVMVQFELTT
jgi:hypothetical protein